jgi:hypothetical protein
MRPPTARSTSATISTRRAAGVRRSLGCLVALGGGARADENVAAALARADCALGEAAGAAA